MSALATAARLAPHGPGVYLFVAEDGELLYVGKARDIRKRLQQHLRPTDHPRGVRMYPQIARVHWEDLADEDAAGAREADLIVCLQPRFNAAIVAEGRWVYVVAGPSPRDPSMTRLALSPTSDGRRAYGCFAHLGRGVSSTAGIACGDGYAAFLRLLWAASGDATNRVPTRLARGAPDVVDLHLDGDLQRPLHAFLSGTSPRLLDTLAERASATRDPYLLPSLARDRGTARAFFVHGPKAVRALRLRHRLPAGPVSRATIEERIAAEVTALVGAFRVSPSATTIA